MSESVLPVGWKMISISELCQTVTSGGTPRRGELRFYDPPEIPWVKTGDLNDDYIYNYSEYISKEGLDNSSAKILPADTVLIAMYGATAGKLGLLREPAACNQAACALIVGDVDTNPRWLFYALLNDRFRIENSANGAAQQNLSGTAIRDLSYLSPPQCEQRAIAEVLGAIDDKIASNRELIQVADDLSTVKFLELMASASVDSRLDGVLSLEYGRALPAPQRISGVVDVYGSGGIAGNHNSSLIDGPGVIVGRKGTVGAVYWSDCPSFPIDTTFYAVPRSSQYPYIFCYFLLKSLPLSENNSDSAVPGLNRAEALATRIKLPDATAIGKFVTATSELFAMTTAVRNESRTLASIRDALLPQLMSGKLRVRDAEKQVEAVL